MTQNTSDYTDYFMTPILKTYPFPHTAITTSRACCSKPEILWDDLINFLAHKYLDPDKWGWVFRGVNQDHYPLESKLERQLKSRPTIDGIDRQTAENYLIAQFKRAAHHFIEASMGPTNETMDWLALMQHYGAPTRLLDFTRSPYIACFFALEKPDGANRKPQSKRAIWAIDPKWLIKSSLGRIESFADEPNFKSENLLNSDTMAKYFDKFFVKNCVPVILPILPRRSNPRLLVQQGLFLCPGATNESFERILSSYGKEKDMQNSVHKILIDGRIRHEVLSELHFMNISRASLFPGLDGFATSLEHELYYKSSDEIKAYESVSEATDGGRTQCR